MTLNCAIIDDEPLAASLLESYVKRTPFLNFIGAYNSAITAMKDIKENRIDLLFLDIQMPELNGLEFAKILTNKTKIVFTTAFSQYAIEGFKANALDYLLKPISYGEFLRVTSKALDWFQTINKQETSEKDRFFFVKSEYKLIKIKFDDILYVEGLKDYIKIYMDNGQKPIMSLMNMKKIEEYLPHPEFLRTHRSYIVHMTKIKTIDRFRIVFANEYIPISDSYKDDVLKYLDSHTLI